MNGNATLNSLVRCYYDLQSTRTRFTNRVKAFDRGASGADDNREITGSLLTVIEEQRDGLEDNEGAIEKLILKELRSQPIWVEWLNTIKGVGTIMGGVMVTSYDIERATTVSKMWQFTGLNPGMVRGWKFVKRDPATHQMIYEPTDTLIRGDRLTAGFRAPFNQWLRSKMIGVLGKGFVMCQNEYAIKYYYPLHVPKARRAELGIGRLDGEEGWRDKSEGHRANAATRYMVKQFLRDLYVAWRTLEGLEVRPPYAEEYLGKKHTA